MSRRPHVAFRNVTNGHRSTDRIATRVADEQAHRFPCRAGESPDDCLLTRRLLRALRLRWDGCQRGYSCAWLGALTCLVASSAGCPMPKKCLTAADRPGRRLRLAARLLEHNTERVSTRRGGGSKAWTLSSGRPCGSCGATSTSGGSSFRLGSTNRTLIMVSGSSPSPMFRNLRLTVMRIEPQ
jgi:hypothetical protein